ncbi:MAG: hypothetical protein WKF94_10250 [Solirubrobacteraceae bacterium]
MSTLAIVLIAVAVIALLAIVFATVLSPKRRAEKKLGAEREHAASHHREVASERHSRASVADQHAEEARLKAESAQQEADMARQEASDHEGRADLHEQGLADHELESGPDRDQTATPEAPTTQIDRPDHLSDRTGEPVQDGSGRYTGDSPTTPRQ